LDKDEQVELTESFSEYLNNTDNQAESVEMIKILLENVDESESQDIVDDINKVYPDIAFTTNLTDKVRDQFMDYFKENFDTTEFNDITANLINEAVNPQVVISDFLRLLNPFSLDELKKQLT
jgi:type III secretory pathway component EscR